MAENLSGSELTKLYNSPVHRAEMIERKLGSSSAPIGFFSHTGVRVTLADNSQWLVHKGDDYSKSSQTVVTKASQMSSGWEVIAERDFEGRRTISDFVHLSGQPF